MFAWRAGNPVGPGGGQGQRQASWVLTLAKALRFQLTLKLMELSEGTAGSLPSAFLPGKKGGEQAREKGRYLMYGRPSSDTWGADQHLGHQEAGSRLDSQGDESGRGRRWRWGDGDQSL